MSNLELYADYGCPYAHRILALLEHLRLEYELHESTLGEKPQGLSEHSPSGRIPLLVHDGLVLTESRVILEYLAERFAWSGAYPEGLTERTRHRLAMALVDEFLTPHLWKSASVEAQRLDEVLDTFESTLGLEPSVDLLSLHVAPIWLHLGQWRPDNAAARAVARRPGLEARLEATVRLPCVRTTSPDFQRVRAELEDARARDLIA